MQKKEGRDGKKRVMERGRREGGKRKRRKATVTLIQTPNRMRFAGFVSLLILEHLCDFTLV